MWAQVSPAPSIPGRNSPPHGRKHWENPRIRPRRNSGKNSQSVMANIPRLFAGGPEVTRRNFSIPVSELKTGTLRGTPLPPVSRRTFREKVLDRKLLTIGTRFPGPPEGRAYDSEPEFTRRNFYISQLRARKGYLQRHTVATPLARRTFREKFLAVNAFGWARCRGSPEDGGFQFGTVLPGKVGTLRDGSSVRFPGGKPEPTYTDRTFEGVRESQISGGSGTAVDPALTPTPRLYSSAG